MLPFLDSIPQVSLAGSILATVLTSVLVTFRVVKLANRTLGSADERLESQDRALTRCHRDRALLIELLQRNKIPIPRIIWVESDLHVEGEDEPPRAK